MSRKKGPRSDGPRARRSFSPGQKLDLLTRYEQAVAAGEGGAFLRREGLYSSLMSEWRRARDAGLLQGKPAGETVGRPSAEQAEIARLRRELERLDLAQLGLDFTPAASITFPTRRYKPPKRPSACRPDAGWLPL